MNVCNICIQSALYYLQKTNAVDSNLQLSYLDYARSLRPQNLAHFIESYVRYLRLCFYVGICMFCHLCSVTRHCVIHGLIEFCALLVSCYIQHVVNVFLFFLFWWWWIFTWVWFQLSHIVSSGRSTHFVTCNIWYSYGSISVKSGTLCHHSLGYKMYAFLPPHPSYIPTLPENTLV